MSETANHLSEQVIAEGYDGRVGLQQRVLPVYRAPFYDALAGSCRKGLGVFAGQPQSDEAIAVVESLTTAQLFPARNQHLFNPGSSLYFCWQTNLRDWLVDWQPDVLILEANPRYLSTPGAIRWMHAREKPVIGWGLGAPAGGLLQPWRRRSWSGFLRQFDALIAYSQRGADQYQACGFPAKYIFVAPNAAAARPTTPLIERPTTFLEQANVLFVGRLQNRKRVDLLLQACAALPTGLQPRLVIVGDGPARPELEHLASQIYPQAEFPGALIDEGLEPYYANADLFVLPGTGGLAVQQAMAHALPVIVAQGDGTQVDLVRPENGWCIPPGDLGMLTACLRSALADAGRLRQMGVAGYRIVAEEINLERMVAEFVKAMRAV